MKRLVINKKNNWDFWTEEDKEALKNAQNNYSLGDKVVYTCEAFRVWTIHLLTGGKLPFHKHSKPYFWTVLSNGSSRSYYNSGEVVEAHYEIGDTVYFSDLDSQNYFIHNLINIGDTTLIFTTVEFLT